MSLKRKILVASIVASLLLAVVGTIAVWSLRDVVGYMRHIAELNLTRVNTLSDMRFYGSEVGRLFLRVSTSGLPQKEVDRLKGKLEDHIALYEKADKSYHDLPFGEGEEALYKTQHEQWEAFAAIVRQGVSLIGSEKPEDLALLNEMVSTKVGKAKVAHNTEFEKLVKYQNDEAEKWKSSAIVAGERGSEVATTVVVLGFVLNIVGGLFFAMRLSQGLELVASRLNSGADEVAGAARVISETSTGLSSGATQQASSLEETASAVTELTAIVSRNATAAEASCRVADDSASAARVGQSVVQEMNDAIAEINAANTDIMAEVQASNKKIADIVKVIAEIGDKTKVINDIVFQTKLLSFNASVEAARAGEQGKGFAVVAEEVGSLAQMSGAAAKEISQLLAVSMERVKSIVDETQANVGRLVEVGRKKVEKGSEVALRCGSSLDTLVSNSSEVNQRVSEISQSTKEQSIGIQEINEAMDQLDEATQRNASAAESAASAAEQLSAQSGHLHTAAKDLLFLIRGSSSASNVERVGVHQADGKNALRLMRTPKSGKASASNSSKSAA